MAAAGNIALDGAILTQIAGLKEDNQEKQIIRVKTAFLKLHEMLSSRSVELKNSLLAIRKAVGEIRAGQLELATMSNSAAYRAGKAAGLGVWNCGAAAEPRECRSHVNTVLNRRYSGFERRYKNALRDAKALAYLARRAVEQRIGMRLETIDTRVGPLEPPATWADDVCRMTGVDYRRLRQEPGLDAGTTTERSKVNAALAAEFADAFIGDYVEKLEHFVEYYNVVYPSHDGDDTAVLSLREDVLRTPGACFHAPYNVLAESGHLNRMVAPSTSSTTSVVRGWQRHKCQPGSTHCLNVLSDLASGMPMDAQPGGAAWLVERPHAPLSGTTDTINTDAIDGPEGLVSQAVTLQPGRYLLSWWDQGRDAVGAAGAARTSYRVSVFDESWIAIRELTDAPWSAARADSWSPRRVLAFDVATPGVFHVAFGAATHVTGQGSVAIASVQLERADVATVPADYQDTGSSASVTAYSCASTPATLRDSYQRVCDRKGACYYDLTNGIQLDTKTLTANGAPLIGRLASGNYNFRHIDVALNLVGTGVRDCAGSPAATCFGSAVIEYTLSHDGTDIGVLGFDGEAREFDFGIGVVEHGKALTAERYITMPVSSNDQTLLQQAGILKPELRGRPLDGTYRLRIYDSPAFRMDRLEDIQIVLKYRYWSRIETPGQF
jgi:hypothetical protein